MLALLMASSSPRLEDVARASVLAMRKKSASPMASLAAATCSTVQGGSFKWKKVSDDLQSAVSRELAVFSGTAFLARSEQCLPTETTLPVTEHVGAIRYLGYVFIHANDLLATHRARLLGPLLVF